MTDWLTEAEAACEALHQIERSLSAGSPAHAKAREKLYQLAPTALPRALAIIRAADELAKNLDYWTNFGCPICGGDCSSANPPMIVCPIRDATEALAAYRKARS